MDDDATVVVDRGRGRGRDRGRESAQSSDTDERRMLVGTGVGLIWQPLASLRVQVYWSLDAVDNFDDDDPRDSESRDKDLQDDGIHFSLNYSRTF
jgi:hemolysin activation/secretion protein